MGLGVHPKASNIGTWGESGRRPLIYDCIRHVLNFHERAKNLNNDSLLSLAYQEQVNCKLDWISNISNIITNNNNIANTQYAHNTDYLRRNANHLEPYQIKNVMSNLINNFDRHWEYSKSTSPKL